MSSRNLWRTMARPYLRALRLPASVPVMLFPAAQGKKIEERRIGLPMSIAPPPFLLAVGALVALGRNDDGGKSRGGRRGIIDTCRGDRKPRPARASPSCRTRLWRVARCCWHGVLQAVTPNPLCGPETLGLTREQRCLASSHFCWDFHQQRQLSGRRRFVEAITGIFAAPVAGAEEFSGKIGSGWCSAIAAKPERGRNNESLSWRRACKRLRRATFLARRLDARPQLRRAPSC